MIKIRKTVMDSSINFIALQFFWQARRIVILPDIMQPFYPQGKHLFIDILWVAGILLSLIAGKKDFILLHRKQVKESGKGSFDPKFHAL
jgi:hypothetical protein